MFNYDNTKSSRVCKTKYGYQTTNRSITYNWEEINKNKNLKELAGISYRGDKYLGWERFNQCLRRVDTDQSVFMYDCFHDMPQAYSEFTPHEIPVNHQDVKGMTGPMYAAQKNSLKMLNFFKYRNNFGIDFKLRNNNGYNLLDIACFYGSLDWVEYAFNCIPATENALNKRKETPLMIAVRGSIIDKRKHEETIRFLLDQNPDLTAQNIYGQTIKDYIENAPVLIRGMIEQKIKETQKEGQKETKIPVRLMKQKNGFRVNITVKSEDFERN